MGGRRLKNAPLREAIFEIFWQSPLDATGFPVDKDFEFALGRFDAIISKDFPIKKRVLPLIGIRVYARPVHQFWKGNIIWPVVQLGPGILTVNETEKNYDWEETYRPNIVNSVHALIKSYDKELPFNKVTLKYIDSVDIESGEDVNKFISQNLQTEIINRFDIPGTLTGININQSFSYDGSNVAVSIQTAINNSNGKKALVWMNTVEKGGKFEFENIISWLDEAHSITSDLFIKMLNPEFYASFNK